MTIFSRLFGRRRKDTAARVKTKPGTNANEASSVGVIGGGGIIPRKYLTRASDSDIVQVTRRVTLLAIAI